MPMADRSAKRLEKKTSPQKTNFFSEEEDETNKEILRCSSPNVSLSSGSLTLEKDSDSEVDISHREITSSNDFSCQSQQEWLKCNLKITTYEKLQLEELITKLSEKSERLKYELADAIEITRNRDEVIKLLQHQLTQMEAAYTKSLEESICSKLQLSSHEQEILYLKKICSKYEEEKRKMTNEVDCKNVDNLIVKIKTLVNEKEQLKKEITQLEKEKLSLKDYLKEVRESKKRYEKEKVENIRVECVKVNNKIQEPTAKNYMKKQKIFSSDTDNLEDVSNFQLWAIISSLKEKSLHLFLRNLKTKKFKPANCEHLGKKPKVNLFQRKQTKCSNNQKKIEKKCNISEKKDIVIHSQCNHDKSVIKHINQDIKSKYEALDNQNFAINLHSGQNNLKGELLLLKSKVNRDFFRKCNSELILYGGKLEKKKQKYQEQMLKNFSNENFKTICKKLAKEKEKFYQIKSKLCNDENWFYTKPAAPVPCQPFIKFYLLPFKRDNLFLGADCQDTQFLF